MPRYKVSDTVTYERECFVDANSEQEAIDIIENDRNAALFSIETLIYVGAYNAELCDLAPEPMSENVVQFPRENMANVWRNLMIENGAAP